MHSSINTIQIDCFNSEIIDTTGLAELHNCSIENNNIINQSNQIQIEFDEDLPF